MRGKGRSDALVFFGASGDLAHKKIFPALYAMVKRGHLDLPVIGVAFSHWDLGQLKDRAKDAVSTHGGIDDAGAFDRLLGLLRYVDGDYADPATFEAIRSELGDATDPTHYLAIPPNLFETVVEQLASSGCARGGRVVVEKPFGHDLASARHLNDVLHQAFPEQAIFRIDHYLGKEETQNLIYFRFSNSFLEPFWNREHIASVQITMAEDFGVEGRGAFYDQTGCLRDVVENHMFQVVSLLAMEPPVNASAEALRDEKGKVFKAMRPLTPHDLVRGQFRGYRDEPGVAPGSDVETFVAVRVHVDSWRWAGVPWYIRAGKELPVHATEVLVELQPPPLSVFSATEPEPERTNYVRFAFNPRVAIAIGARVKTPGESFQGEQTELVFHDDDTSTDMSPYERLLGDAMEGDASLFARQDSVEAAWEVVDHVLAHHGPARPYAPGTWGPEEADALIARHGAWHEPEVS